MNWSIAKYVIIYFTIFPQGLTAPVGSCLAGHYCTLGAIDQNPIGQSYGDYCTAGHYCETGTGTPTPCPIGTYLPDTGKSHVSDCISCYPGKYCETTGLTNFTGMYNFIFKLTENWINCDCQAYIQDMQKFLRIRVNMLLWKTLQNYLAKHLHRCKVLFWSCVVDKN